MIAMKYNRHMQGDAKVTGKRARIFRKHKKREGY